MYKQLVRAILGFVLLTACAPSRTSSVQTNKWGDFPIMPGAKEVTDHRADIAYHYTIDASIKSVERFYQVGMKDTAWNLLGVADARNSEIPGFSMFYAKGNETAQIDIWLQENTTHVAFTK